MSKTNPPLIFFNFRCRLCAEEKPCDNRMQNLAHSKKLKRSFIEKLKYVGGEFYEFFGNFNNKLLPEIVCGDCHEALEASHRFFLNMENAKLIYSNLCEEQKNDEESIDIVTTSENNNDPLKIEPINDNEDNDIDMEMAYIILCESNDDTIVELDDDDQERNNLLSELNKSWARVTRNKNIRGCSAQRKKCLKVRQENDLGQFLLPDAPLKKKIKKKQPTSLASSVTRSKNKRGLSAQRKKYLKVRQKNDLRKVPNTPRKKKIKKKQQTTLASSASSLPNVKMSSNLEAGQDSWENKLGINSVKPHINVKDEKNNEDSLLRVSKERKRSAYDLSIRYNRAMTAAERARRYRERIKQNPEKYEQHKKKELERSKKIQKRIKELTEEEKIKKRKIWREQKKRQKQKIG